MSSIWYLESINLFKILCPYKFGRYKKNHTFNEYNKSDYIYFADEAANKVYLRTPTDESGTNNGNDENGIRFGIPGTMRPAVGFGLPILNAGQKYEAQVVIDGVGPISTGTFSELDTQDHSNVFSGTLNNAGPPIPGEDYFNNEPEGFTFPLDLRNRTVVISVEPSPDNSPGPFSIKPLVGMSGQDTAPTTYDLTYSAMSFPSRTVIR